MKHHMKTVKHQLEAKKYTIAEESTEKTDVQGIQIEADLLSEIQTVNTPQILMTEVPNEQTNRLIVTSEMNPDIGPIIQLNTVLEKGPNPPNIEAIDTNKTAKGCTNEQNEEKVTENLDSDDPKKNAKIENVIENLLKASNEDQVPNIEDDKEKNHHSIPPR